MAAALGAAAAPMAPAAGATRASITAHFALRDNLADVSAKENAQETAINLVGLLLGSAFARPIGDSPALAWLAFALLTLLHVWANWVGVGCLTFYSINPQRAALLSRRWRELSASGASATERRAALAPAAIASAHSPVSIVKTVSIAGMK